MNPLEILPVELRIILSEYFLEPSKSENDGCLKIFKRYDRIVLNENILVLPVSSEDKKWKKEIDQAVHLFRDVMLARSPTEDLQIADHEKALDLWAIHPIHEHSLLMLRANIGRFAKQNMTRLDLGALLGIWEKAMELYQTAHMKRHVPLEETELRHALRQGTAQQLRKSGMFSVKDLRETAQSNKEMFDFFVDDTPFPQPAVDMSAKLLKVSLKCSNLVYSSFGKMHSTTKSYYTHTDSVVRYSKEIPAALKRLEEQRDRVVCYEGFGPSLS